MMKFITNPICPFAQRVWLVLLESETPHEYVVENIKAGEKSSYFTATYRSALGADVTSDGKVPVLVDGDIVLTESAVVAECE
jgi:glutathione S-transferase